MITFDNLTVDCIECVGCHLDYRTAINLTLVSKTVREKLLICGRFWKHLCKIQEFTEHPVLKSDQAEDLQTTYDGQNLHPVVLDKEEQSYWRRIFLRGIEMKRNIHRGKYRYWRLYLTDKDHLPVKELKCDTVQRDLKKIHTRSPKVERSRRRRGERCWNDEYFVAIQGRCSSRYTEVFVWKWFHGRNPQFLCSKDVYHMYPYGLFPTTFFIWSNYLVVLPRQPVSETSHRVDEGVGLPKNCILQVHDLSKELEVVGSYSVPPNTVFAVPSNTFTDTYHAQVLDDKAVLFLRTDRPIVFVFALPDCKLMYKSYVPVLTQTNINDCIDQIVLKKERSLYFWLSGPEYTSLDDLPITSDHYSRLLQLDFTESTSAPKFRICQQFELMRDHENFNLEKDNKYITIDMKGMVSLKELIFGETTITVTVVKSLPAPDDYIQECLSEGEDGPETDGPNILYSHRKDLFVLFRHFVSGRKVHALSEDLEILYELNVDVKAYGLHGVPNYMYCDVFGDFVGLADHHRIVFFQIDSGKFVSKIEVPKHWGYRVDQVESMDRYSWKGFEYAFSEDGIIIIPNKWNYPVAADVLLFW